MTSLTPLASLFEVLTSQQDPTATVSIAPSTLKNTLTSWLEVLASQTGETLVWAKLPRGEAWHTDLQRYSLGSNDRTVYLIKSLVDEISEPAPTMSPTLDPMLGASLMDTFVPTTFHLGTETPLRREFFILVVSEHFCGVLAAQRLRVKRSDVAEASDDRTVDRRNHLAVTCQVGWAAVEPILAHLEAILETSVEETTARTGWEARSGWQVKDYVEEWRSKLSQWSFADQQATTLLLNQQLQRQDDLWHRMTQQRKQSEMVEILQLQNDELNRSVKSKDEFMNTMGQELRTPLTNMKTALTLLNSPNLKPPQRQRYMDLLVKECDRQSSLIGSLLDLVSLDQMAERETLQPISLAEIVPGVVSTYQPLAEEKGVRLAYTIPEDLPSIACLNPWLRQIVIGLLHNGIKFTATGGQVWVRAKQQGDFVQLEFKDTGIGISVQEIPKIFDRFYRVRSTTGEDLGGAGLGLTIVQQLLLRCGGSISVKSRPGEGSIFSVMLPIYQYRESV